MDRAEMRAGPEEEVAHLVLRYNIGVRENRTVVIKRLNEDLFES